jgi:hypothetical protein
VVDRRDRVRVAELMGREAAANAGSASRPLQLDAD